MNRMWAHRQKDLDLIGDNRSGLRGDIDSILQQSTPEAEEELGAFGADSSHAGDQLADLARAQA